jgi:hypothetical protein
MPGKNGPLHLNSMADIFQLYFGRVAVIEIRLYRKGACILADIHGMDHFCTKLAPPRSCVSKIHTPMVMVWFGNV